MIEIGYTELALGAVLLLIHGVISFIYQTGTGRQLIIAAARMVVQLGLMAYVLVFLFKAESAFYTFLAAFVMIGFAGYEVLSRQSRPMKQGWGYAIATVSMFVAAAIVMSYALTIQIKPDPWYAPRYLVPLLGMVLGMTMNAVSLGLNHLSEALSEGRDAVEARLALGEGIWQATNHVIRKALKTALMGIINNMSAAGLVFIPGMMTGQLMAGADPIQAAKYQIMIMFLIAGGTAIAATLAVLLGIWRLTDARHRLRLERLRVK